MFYNHTVLVGNLTRDPELKHTASNQAVCNASLAVNRSYTTKEGEQREETLFIDLEMWGKQAETFAKYMNKGRSVLVDGMLKQDKWTDGDGNNRSKILLRVSNFKFLSQGGGKGKSTAEKAQDVEDMGGSDLLGDDEIPF